MFYAGTAGQEAAQLVALDLSAALAPGAATVTQLVPLSSMSLALVPSALTFLIPPAGAEPGSAPAENQEAALSGPPTATAISFGQSLSSRASGFGGGPDEPPRAGEDRGLVPGAMPATNPSWERFFLGLDEILEGLTKDPAGTSENLDSTSLGGTSQSPPFAVRAIRLPTTIWPPSRVVDSARLTSGWPEVPLQTRPQPRRMGLFSNASSAMLAAMIVATPWMAQPASEPALPRVRGPRRRRFR